MPAENYDHRDYALPLAVEPVCVGCNLRRGPGLNRGAVRLRKKRETPAVVEVPFAFYRPLRLYALHHGQSVKAIVAEALTQHLAKLEKK